MGLESKSIPFSLLSMFKWQEIFSMITMKAVRMAKTWIILHFLHLNNETGARIAIVYHIWFFWKLNFVTYVRCRWHPYVLSMNERINKPLGTRSARFIFVSRPSSLIFILVNFFISLSTSVINSSSPRVSVNCAGKTKKLVCRRVSSFEMYLVWVRVRSIIRLQNYWQSHW